MACRAVLVSRMLCWLCRSRRSHMQGEARARLVAVTQRLHSIQYRAGLYRSVTVTS